MRLTRLKRSDRCRSDRFNRRRDDDDDDENGKPRDFSDHARGRRRARSADEESNRRRTIMEDEGAGQKP